MNSAALLEIIIVALLTATCLYCIVLTRRLKALRDGQESLQAAIATFDEATRRAERNLARMEKEGVSATRDLGAVMKKAGDLASELSVMVSAGDTIAARIEDAMNDVRALAGRRAAGDRQ